MCRFFYPIVYSSTSYIYSILKFTHKFMKYRKMKIISININYCFKAF